MGDLDRLGGLHESAEQGSRAAGWLACARRRRSLREHLEASGFEGFLPLRDLRSCSNGVADECGVYVVLRESRSLPRFLPRSPAGWFKGLDPSYPLSILKEKWVAAADIIYIGKAGPADERTIRRRVTEFLKFGAGAPIGHRGGRAIWQLPGVWSCLLAWRACPGSIPRQHEKALISEFEGSYGKIPFANFRR